MRWKTDRWEDRHEIASCEEKAYDSLPLSDAATLLFFNNMQEVSSFANEVSLYEILESMESTLTSYNNTNSAAGRSIPPHKLSSSSTRPTR